MTLTFGRSAALGCSLLLALLMMFTWAPHTPQATAASSVQRQSSAGPLALARRAATRVARPARLLHTSPSEQPPVPPRSAWIRHFGELEVGVGGTTLEDHLSRVREVLIERHGAAQSEEFFELYGRFANYQLALEQDVAAPRADPFDPAEGLAQVAHQRALAREMLGDDEAADLVEPDLARREYLLRREQVLTDPLLSAEAKAAELHDLGPAPAHAAPIARNRLDEYHEALQLHAQELGRSTDEEAAQLKARLRQEVFGTTLAAQHAP